MTQRTIVRCDRRSCRKEVELPTGTTPYSIQIQGVWQDLCPACARAHRAFMIGGDIPENWSMLGAEGQQRWLDEQVKRPEGQPSP